MKKDRTCKYCNVLFENIEGKIFSNHVKYCDKNFNHNDKEYRSKIKKQLLLYWKEKQGEYKQFKVVCNKCQKSFFVKEKEKLFPLKEKYYCSYKCSNSRNITNIQKENVRKSLLKFNKLNGKGIKETLNCLYCNKKIIKYVLQNRKFCSKDCFYKWKIKEYNKYLTEREIYKKECQFDFTLNDFPNEFNFDLINIFGWYQAKNRGNNLNGISRDHIISIDYGFKNKIPSKLIKHPANCQLLRHKENQSKRGKAGLTLKELENKISVWDKKYIGRSYNGSTENSKSSCVGSTPTRPAKMF